MSRAWTPSLRPYRTRDPHGLRLIGEVRTTVLDVSELGFADVGAASALARARRDAASTARARRQIRALPYPAEVGPVACRSALSRLLALVGGAGGTA